VAAVLPSAGCNTLLGDLPHRERDRFLSLCQPFELNFGTVLCDVGVPYRHAYFPTSGLISLVSSLRDQKPLEMALVGQEGMLGATLLLGIGTVPVQALVHTPGVAQRITVAKLRRQLRDSPVLHRILSHYLYMKLVELSLVGGCIRYHRIGQRLARSLLLAHDRARDDFFYLTHSYLADMLGVRRSSITVAAGELQDRKLISYARGGIRILDRPGLEAMSCECYQLLRARQGRSPHGRRRPH
jgi:CRP-like cAMP-binding protein